MNLKNIEKWQEIYENNKKLDEIFTEKYGNDKKIYEQNCIEFLVELGEFINETKCFKFWSIKKPKKDEMLEECADCITMILYFYNKLNLNLKNIASSSLYDSNNLLEILNYEYLLGTKLMHTLNEDLAEKLLANLIYISNLLNLEEQDILDAIDKKHHKIYKRLNSDY